MATATPTPTPWSPRFPSREQYPSTANVFPTQSSIPVSRDDTSLFILRETIKFPFNEAANNRLAFSELLVISHKLIGPPRPFGFMDPTDDDVGAMYLSIQSDPVKPNLNISLAMQINDAGRSETVTTDATLTRGLDLIEERYHETVDGKTTKSLVLKPNTLGRHSFTSFVVNRHGVDREYRAQKLHSIKRGVDFITQGADLILKRFWAINGFVGSIEGQTVDIAGGMSTVIYSFEPKKMVEMNGRQLEVVEIVRTVVKKDIRPEVTRSLLSTTGYLVEQEFHCNGCWYVAHLVSSSSIPFDNFEINWRMRDGKDGPGWLTMHQDHQRQRFDELKDFIKNYPQIQNFIKDYVLCLILEKPENVIEFSERYFAGFIEPGRGEVDAEM